MHMKIRIRYFASLREITGQNEELLMVDERTSVADIRPLLVTRYPRLQRGKPWLCSQRDRTS